MKQEIHALSIDARAPGTSQKRPLKKLAINGGYPLNGSIKISGAKNAALPMMTASILSNHDITLNGIPDLADVRTMIILLESMGIKANKNHEESKHIIQKIT